MKPLSTIAARVSALNCSKYPRFSALCGLSMMQTFAHVCVGSVYSYFLLLGSRNRLCTAYYIRMYCGMVVPCCIIHHCCLPLTVYVHSIITQLEKLKKEAAEEARNSKMEETDIVMAEIEGGSQEYTVYAFLSFLFVHLLHFRRPVTNTFLACTNSLSSSL